MNKLPWPRDERFLVQEDGTIIGPRGKPLSPIVQRGRASITVYQDGIWQTVKIAVIVCETFHGPRPTATHHAAHENGDPSDDRASNLSWKTPQENEADKVRHGTSLHGERHHQARITEVEAEEIRVRRIFGQTLAHIGAVYGLGLSQVSRICRGASW